MNYEFNNEYLAKSLMSLIHDEGNRILSLGLVGPDELKNLVESTIKMAVKHASQHGSGELLGALAVLHKDLSSVKLEGDFKKVSADIEDKFFIALGIPGGIFSFDEDKSNEKVEEVVEEKEDDANDIPVKEVVFSFILPVLEKLEKLAYDFGINGNHKAAYTVERKIMEIKSLALTTSDTKNNKS